MLCPVSTPVPDGAAEYCCAMYWRYRMFSATCCALNVSWVRAEEPTLMETATKNICRMPTIIRTMIAMAIRTSMREVPRRGLAVFIGISVVVELRPVPDALRDGDVPDGTDADLVAD